jgi:hypothetical protein
MISSAATTNIRPREIGAAVFLIEHGPPETRPYKVVVSSFTRFTARCLQHRTYFLHIEHYG